VDRDHDRVLAEREGLRLRTVVVERLEPLPERPSESLVAAVDTASARKLAGLDQLDLGVEEQVGGRRILLRPPQFVVAAQPLHGALVDRHRSSPIASPGAACRFGTGP
jgi:hypothetical protein